MHNVGLIRPRSKVGLAWDAEFGNQIPLSSPGAYAGSLASDVAASSDGAGAAGGCAPMWVRLMSSAHPGLGGHRLARLVRKLLVVPAMAVGVWMQACRTRSCALLLRESLLLPGAFGSLRPMLLVCT
jgi:hypothetical protein